MRNYKNIAAGIFALSLLTASFAFADSPSISIQDISPGTTVPVRNVLTFTAVPSGFSGTLFVLSDSFAGAASTSISGSNISGGGKFYWTPTVTDVGTHVLLILSSDNVGNSASTTQTITVSPPPSVSIQSISPGTAVMPGTKLTFTASTTGFTNPKYIVGDTFSNGTSITALNIDATGNFSWTPDTSQNGNHPITIYVTDSLGQGASAKETIRVGVGPTLSVQSFAAEISTSAGQNVSFLLSASGYSPTAFSLVDKFSGTTTPTLSNQNIALSGSFSWTPQANDIGTHVITIVGTVGMYGESANTTETITVLGPGGYLPSVSSAPASTTISATSSATASGTSLSLLLAAVAQLQSQIATASASDARASTLSSSGFTFSTRLYPGLESDDVAQLQSMLSQQGFFSTTPNGRYGPLTAAAVKKFQAAHGLAPLGAVGPATRAALNALLSGSKGEAAAPAGAGPGGAGGGFMFKNFVGRGDKGTDVAELQKRLITLGFFSGEPTGYFGSATEAAVKKFQSAKGIRAAGYVGPATRAALNQ